MVLYKGISIKYTVNQQDKQTDKTDCIMKKHRYKRQKKKQYDRTDVKHINHISRWKWA